MTGRPECLFPLFADVQTLPGVGPRLAKTLANVQITRPRDLIFTLPAGGIDRRPVASIRDVSPPCVATVEVTIGRHHPPSVRGRPYRVFVTDAATEFTLVFFHANVAEKYHVELSQFFQPFGKRLDVVFVECCLAL